MPKRRPTSSLVTSEESLLKRFPPYIPAEISAGKDREKEVLALVEERGKDHEVVVLSTHMEFIDYFPTIWGDAHSFRIPTKDMTPKGTARVVDVRTGRVEFIDPN